MAYFKSGIIYMCELFATCLAFATCLLSVSNQLATSKASYLNPRLTKSFKQTS